MPVIHVIVPCFDEPKTLRPCLDRVLAAKLPAGWSRNVILVDDCSAEETAVIARNAADTEERIRLIRHERNLGKGAAVRSGFHVVVESATDEDIVVVQDADLEYDPEDLATMIEAFADPEVDAVFGDRFARGTLRSPLGHAHTKVNRGLTHASNLVTGLDVADMECCYKLIRTPMLIRILPELDEDRFGIEPQITAALGRAKARIENVAISYTPRGFDEGKKIGLFDGVRALFIVAREWFSKGKR